MSTISSKLLMNKAIKHKRNESLQDRRHGAIQDLRASLRLARQHGEHQIRQSRAQEGGNGLYDRARNRRHYRAVQ